MRTVRPKVLVTRTIPEAGLRLLDAECDVEQWRSDEVIPRDTLKAMLADKDACLTLVTERFDADLFDTAPHCAGLRPWLLFREPLLATCVHGLACLAAALNRARTV